MTKKLTSKCESADTEFFIKKGFMDINDEVVFKRIYEACNCFGHNYKGFQRGGTRHPYRDDVHLWFPKLNSKGKWINTISQDENTILERPENSHEVEEHMNFHIHKPINRIVFAYQEDNQGQWMYRFKGEYKIDVQQSLEKKCLVWVRISKRVETYPPKLKTK